MQKRFIGVFQEGNDLKIAGLVLDNRDLKIDFLYKEKLPEDLKKNEEIPTFSEPVFESEIQLEDQKETAKIQDWEDFDFTSLDMPDGDKPEKPQNGKGKTADSFRGGHRHTEKLTTFQIIRKLSEQLHFADNDLGVNVEVSNVSYKKLDLPKKMSAKKTLSYIIKELNNDKMLINPSFSFVKVDNRSIMSIVHEGKMDLLENLFTISQIDSKKSFRFQAVIPNEINLINAVRLNYQIGEEDLSAIFYVGNDFSRITLMKGKQFFMALPIIGEGYANPQIITTLYARYLLEKTHFAIPPLNRIFIAGENLSEKMILDLKVREPDITIELLLPMKVLPIDNTLNEYSTTTLAEFIIPVTMAYSVMNLKNPDLLMCNLLPGEVKEQQNVFSFSLSGFLVMILILGTILLGISDRMKIYNKVTQSTMVNTRLKNDLAINKVVIDSIKAMQVETADIQKNISRTKMLIVDKNQWHYILEQLSISFKQNPMSWITNIQKEKSSFRIQGLTTNRKNVLVFSTIFPNGKIEKVNSREIEKFKVYEFSISYSMPDPLETKRLDYLKEGIVFYSESEKKKDALLNTQKPKMLNLDAERKKLLEKLEKENRVKDLNKKDNSNKEKESSENKNATAQKQKITNTPQKSQDNLKIQPAKAVPKPASPTPKKDSVKLNPPAKQEITKNKKQDVKIEKNAEVKKVTKAKPVQKPEEGIQSKPKTAPTKTALPDSLQNNFVEAVKIFKAGKLDNSINSFSNIISNTNDQNLISLCLFYKAEAYNQKNEIDKAKINYEKVIQLNKKKVDDSLNELGRIYLMLGERQKAKTTWEKLLKYYPKSKYSNQVKNNLDALKE